MSIKTLFFAGAATFALCTGAQAQVAIVGSQSNYADVYATQSRNNTTGGGPQRIDQSVDQSNVAVPVNANNIRFGGGGYGHDGKKFHDGKHDGKKDGVAVVGEQSNKAILTAKQDRGHGRSHNNTTGGAPQRIDQTVTQSNVAVPLNLNNIRVGGFAGFAGIAGR